MPTILPLWLIAALCSITSASAGQILLKIGVRSAALPSDSLEHPNELLNMLLNPYVAAGVFAYAASMVLWLAAINGQELSRVYPMAALGYVLVTIVSVKLFHDEITVWKVAGIALIILGVIVLNQGAGTPTDIPPTLPPKSG
ncbi:MAG TPA: EamA family transporter [Candidatus Baltobacteraceae bacterium]|nr:EamA family transporter [Candidatus Baltobacteraceae bacterium]